MEIRREHIATLLQKERELQVKGVFGKHYINDLSGQIDEPLYEACRSTPKDYAGIDQATYEDMIHSRI